MASLQLRQLEYRSNTPRQKDRPFKAGEKMSWIEPQSARSRHFCRENDRRDGSFSKSDLTNPLIQN
jgi:hypothetical protein